MSTPDIYVTRWGDEGPKIVLVHGSAQGSSVGGDAHFAGQEALTGRGWQLLLPDRPGHGRSPAAGRPDDYMLDGEWVADLLGEEGGHLVGHSYGGLVALAAAAHAPERVRSLTLIEAAMQGLTLDDPRTLAFIKQMGEAMAQATSLADMAARFSKVAGIPDSIRGRRGEGELEAVGKGLSQIRLPTTDQLEALVASVAAHDIPLLVVTGGWNPGIEASSDRAASLAHGRRDVIHSPHHFPQNHDAEAFNALFLDFIGAAEAARA